MLISCIIVPDFQGSWRAEKGGRGGQRDQRSGKVYWRNWKLNVALKNDVGLGRGMYIRV